MVRLLAVGLLAAILVFDAKPSEQAWAEKAALIRLAFVDDWRALPALVAIERGFFAAEGLIVSGLPFATQAEIEASFAEETTDLALIPQRMWLAMADAGAGEIAIGVGGGGAEMELVVREGRPIEALADLKNRRVFITQGSPAFPILVRLLNQAGLEPEAVRIIEQPTDDVLASFQRRRADAVFDIRHATTPLAAEQGQVLVDAATITSLVGSLNAIPLVARADLVTDQPETLERVMAAWIKTLAYIDANQEDAARLLYVYLRRRGFQIVPSLAEAWVGLGRYDLATWTPEAIKDTEFNAWALMMSGELGDLPDLPSIIETRFGDEASMLLAPQ